MHEKSTKDNPVETPDAASLPMPSATGATRRPAIGLRAALLVICPLAAAAIAVVGVGPRFKGNITLAVSASTGPDAIRTNVDPIGAWADRIATLVQRSVQQGASVSFDRSASRLLVTIERDRLAELRQTTANLAGSLKSGAEKLSAEAADRARKLREPLIDEQTRIRNELSLLADASTAYEAGDMSSDVLDALLQSVQSAEESRRIITRLRTRQEETKSRRDNLIRAPLPSVASIDPEARKRAYGKDTVLQQDLRHLEVQLAQIRSALLEVWERASGGLDDVLAASDNLQNLLDAPEALSAGGDLRAALERVVGLAADHHYRVTRFAQEWTQSFVNLRDMPLDPTDTAMLDASDRLAEAARQQVFESTQALTAIRRSLHDATEQADSLSRGHAISAVALRSLRELETAQRSFDRAVSDLYARDNYLLDAARHTARALLHRTGKIRQELDTDLNNAAREQARTRRQREVADLTAELSAIRAEAGRRVDELLNVQKQIRELAIKTPTEARALGDRLLVTSKRAWLGTQLEHIENALEQTVAPSDISVRVTVIAASADDVPANLTVLLVTGGGVWGLAIMGMLLTWRLGPRI